jgi:hypothetical protein
VEVLVEQEDQLNTLTKTHQTIGWLVAVAEVLPKVVDTDTMLKIIQHNQDLVEEEF